MDWIMLVLASVGAGALAAMGLGGGGVLLLYLSAVGMQQLMAQGINLLFVIPVGLCSLCFHRKNGLVDLSAALPIAIGGIAGVWLGVLIAGGLSQELLRRLFGGLVLVIGIREIWFGIRCGKENGFGLFIRRK
ncbi:MAG: sulfite exporter TauE/SafE family protein [Angelakisella sp.]|nr:sulfite exporter TauE/SafE family protein [Angelakisella sp.]